MTTYPRIVASSLLYCLTYLSMLITQTHTTPQQHTSCNLTCESHEYCDTARQRCLPRLPIHSKCNFSLQCVSSLKCGNEGTCVNKEMDAEMTLSAIFLIIVQVAKYAVIVFTVLFLFWLIYLGYRKWQQRTRKKPETTKQALDVYTTKPISVQDPSAYTQTTISATRLTKEESIACPDRAAT